MGEEIGFGSWDGGVGNILERSFSRARPGRDLLLILTWVMEPMSSVPPAGLLEPGGVGT